MPSKLRSPIYVMREIFFPFAWGGGGPPRFFFCENRMQMMHSESIHSLLGVGIFLKFHFCHKSPDVQGMWWGFSPHLQGILWKTEDPRVNFEKRFAHYEIYTWTLCHSYLHEKQTSKIQSLKQVTEINELCYINE